MNAVIPWIGPDSRELRYALRSIETFLPDITGVIIIGYSLPHWLRNINHIKFRDRFGAQWAHKNVWDKVNLVPDEKFLFVADDHFLLEEHLAETFPAYYTGPISGVVAGLKPENPYARTMQNTMDLLKPGAKAFNTHCPFVVHKKDLKKLAKHDWTKPYGYCLKTLLLQNKAASMQHNDLKLRAERVPDLTGRSWFSTSPLFMSRGGEALLKRLYPYKSKWEA